MWRVAPISCGRRLSLNAGSVVEAPEAVPDGSRVWPAKPVRVIAARRTALRSPADVRIFAVGDCARFLPSPLPRIGVFGVRQAPSLLQNHVAALAGAQHTEYHPPTALVVYSRSR